MYNQNSIVIAIILFLLILLANELGCRLARRFNKNASEDVKSQTNAIQAGILGLLALLLGFTFSMAIQRYDNRFQAQIHEANSIGTALLRTKLLPGKFPVVTHALLQEYIDLRLEINDVDLTLEKERSRINEKTAELQDKLWENASAAVDLDPRPVTTGLFVSALNEMIDAQGKRNAIIQQHVPEIIFYLLFMVFIATGALMGYSSGLSKVSSRTPTIIFTLLIVLVVFIIIDLDRPKRSIIKVKQDIMNNLKSID